MNKLGTAEQKSTVKEETICAKAERNKGHSKLTEEVVHYCQRKLERHSWARSARALNANVRNLNLGKESGEPYARVESKEVSDLHFNKKIPLEAKITGEGEDWKQDNQEINTKVHVRDGKTQN